MQSAPVPEPHACPCRSSCATSRPGAWNDWATWPVRTLRCRRFTPSRRVLNAKVSAFPDLLRHSSPQAAPEELTAYLVG